MANPITPVSSGSSPSPAFAVGQLLDEYTLGNYISTRRADNEDASQPVPADERKRETEAAQPSGTTTAQHQSYATAQSTGSKVGTAPTGNVPQNVPTGLREQLVGEAIHLYENGQLTDASSKLPGNISQQQALLALQALGVNPAALQQQSQQAAQSAAFNSRIATDRA
jgi:hypothetical protein